MAQETQREKEELIVRDEWHTVKHRNKEINSKTKPRN